ncbi:MAG: type III pantothenate kinase [Pirellulales bacterium]
MTQAAFPPLIAVDIGNSRIKVGRFAGERDQAGLPIPSHVLELSASSFDPASLTDSFAAAQAGTGTTAEWWIASVNRAPTEQLTAWLKERAFDEFDSSKRHERGASVGSSERSGYCLLKHLDLPLAVELPQPDRVGIDRLLGAVAANQVRAAGRAAVVVGVGTAITVDLVSPAGAFLGGAILPGIGISARAMHDFTDRLPLVTMEELADPPPALGTSTIEAMRSGLYWGALGAMKELIARLAGSKGALASPSESREIFLTGGAAPVVAQFLDPGAKLIPHLVLGGIALVAE